MPTDQQCAALAWTEAVRQVRCCLPLGHEGEHEEPSTHGGVA